MAAASSRERRVGRIILGVAAVAAAATVWLSFRYRDLVFAPRPEPPRPALTAEEPPAATEAVVYFADEQYLNLVPEKRPLPNVANAEERIRLLVEFLVAGPHEQTHAATLPPDVRLKSVFLRDRVALLNFDERLRSRSFGTTGELYVYRSIYATVTANVADVDGVTILIDGEPSHTLAGEGGHLASGFPLYGDLGRFVAPAPHKKP